LQLHFILFKTTNKIFNLRIKQDGSNNNSVLSSKSSVNSTTSRGIGASGVRNRSRNSSTSSTITYTAVQNNTATKRGSSAAITEGDDAESLAVSSVAGTTHAVDEQLAPNGEAIPSHTYES
jgi:hypothetical protein